jgi:hypothetical protein
MSEVELKPCPFCGGKAECLTERDHHGAYFTLGCSDTDCIAYHLSYTLLMKDFDVIAAAWNRRAGEG